MLLPVILIAGLEIALRVAGYGHDLSLFRTARADPTFWQINPQTGVRYFPVQGVQPAVALTDLFRKEKANNGLRVFVLGGSSTAGYPYLYNASFPSILQVILQDIYPEKEVEVVNLGMTAVASYTVRDLALRLADFQPDMLLVYSGHNEFYGALGAGSSESFGNSRWLVKTALFLSDFRIFQLLSSVISSAGTSFGEGTKSQTLMETMVANRAIPFNSPVFFDAAEAFAANIADVADFCDRQDIPLLVGSLVSNITDQAPFVDVFAAGQQPAGWIDLQQRIDMSMADGDTSSTLDLLAQQCQLDTLAASPHFRLGQLILQGGDSTAAKAEFYRAKDLDGLRFRAAEILNRKIRNVAVERQHVYHIDIQEAFEAASPDGIPGKTLLLEHLHPNVDGYLIMARAFAGQIQKILPPAKAARLPSHALLSTRIGVTEIDHEVARIRIDYLMSGWPFRPLPPPPAAEYRIADATPIQTLALRFWRDEITWEKMHVEAAQWYQKEGLLEKAADEYRALIRATPMNSSPYTLLASLLSQQQKYQEALPVYLKLAELEPSVNTFKMIGGIYLQTGQIDRGLPWLRNALDVQPNNLDVRFLLAQGLAVKQSWPEAEKELVRILGQQPNYPGADELLKMIQSR